MLYYYSLSSSSFNISELSFSSSLPFSQGNTESLVALINFRISVFLYHWEACQKLVQKSPTAGMPELRTVRICGMWSADIHPYIAILLCRLGPRDSISGKMGVLLTHRGPTPYWRVQSSPRTRACARNCARWSRVCTRLKLLALMPGSLQRTRDPPVATTFWFV